MFSTYVAADQAPWCCTVAVHQGWTPEASAPGPFFLDRREWERIQSYGWWFRNLANQLRLVVYLPLFTRFDTSQVVQDFFHQLVLTLRIQICPKKGISPIILFSGWDWDHQSYSRKGSGFLGIGQFTTPNAQWAQCMVYLPTFTRQRLPKCRSIDHTLSIWEFIPKPDLNFFWAGFHEHWIADTITMNNKQIHKGFESGGSSQPTSVSWSM